MGEDLGGVWFDYRRGWGDGLSLSEHLKSNRESEFRIGYTLYGAHRADLRMRVAKVWGKRLSKGQLKVAAFELIIALHEYISENGSTDRFF